MKETTSENLQKGIELVRQGRFDKAEDYFFKALGENFNDYEALYYLGTTYIRRNAIPLAAQFFMRALECNPNSFESWNNLGNCFKAINDEKNAERCWTKALDIPNKPPDWYADIYNNFGTLHVNSGTPEDGLKYIDRAIELCPNHWDAVWNKALMCLEQGNYENGWDYYAAGFKNKNRLYRNYGDGIADWDGSEGKTIIVWGEQGIGDEILFSSIVPDLIKVSKKVILDCHPRLVGIFKESFPECDVYGTRKDEFIEWPLKYKEANAKVAIGDLGRFFRRDIKDFPGESYLKAPKEAVKKYRHKLKKLGDKPKIGISWTGGYTKTRKDYRTIDLELWKPILTQDADFISLQYTPDAYRAVADVEDKLGVRIHHWPSVMEGFDYGDTAGLVANLDLVITVNTSIHHLAGALGKDVWTLTPKAKAWRYYSEDGVKNPWYGSCRQYQQKQLGNWKEIIDKVAADLKDIL